MLNSILTKRRVLAAAAVAGVAAGTLPGAARAATAPSVGLPAIHQGPIACPYRTLRPVDWGGVVWGDPVLHILSAPGGSGSAPGASCLKSPGPVDPPA
jgi:hypothetical protein